MLDNKIKILITRRLWGELVDDVLAAKEQSKGSPGEKFVCLCVFFVARLQVFCVPRLEVYFLHFLPFFPSLPG